MKFTVCKSRLTKEPSPNHKIVQGFHPTPHTTFTKAYWQQFLSPKSNLAVKTKKNLQRIPKAKNSLKRQNKDENPDTTGG